MKSINTYAPVIIPTLNRFDHFYQCLESLEACVDADKTDVFVALDYPPSEKYVNGWKQIDDYLHEKEKSNGFKSLTVYRRETNYVISGKGNGRTARQEATKDRDRFIYSEDDNVFAPNFLVYMNTCLEAYYDDDEVIAVCGYSYPVEWKVDEKATCFRQQINNSSWGAGSWVHKNKVRDNEIKSGVHIKELPNVIKGKRYKKMIDACLCEYIPSACSPIRAKKDMICRVSDIGKRSYLASMNKYAITPVVSKVRNLGFDGSGKYCQAIIDNFSNTAGTYDYSHQPIDTSSTFELIEDTLHDNEENRKRLNDFDYRSPKQMAKTKRLIWLCENIGIWSAKLYYLLTLPANVLPKVWKKIIKSR